MNFKKSKIRSLVLLALAAVAFCGLIWFANKDRPVYRSSNMAVSYTHLTLPTTPYV